MKMKQTLRQKLWAILILTFSTLSSFSNAQRYGHGGGGWAGAGGGSGGMGMGMGMNSGSGSSRREMMQLIHQLVDSHEDVTRYYNETEVGIESYTFSDDPDITSWIQEHVRQMVALMTTYPQNGGIRLRDPLFRAAFDFSSFHEMTVTNTQDGVHVVQKVVADVDDANTKACTIDIIKGHAAVVSKFVTRGRSEMRKNHEAPTTCNAAARTIPEDTRTRIVELTAQDTTVTASALATTTANDAAAVIGSGIQTATILTFTLFVIGQALLF